MKKILNNILSTEIYRKSISSVVLRIIGILIGYIFILYLSKLFGPKGVGIYSLSFIFMNIFSLFGRVGADTLIMRDISKYKALNKIREFKLRYKSMISLLMITASVSTLVSLLCIPFIINVVYHKPEMMNHVFLISCCVIPYTFSLLFVEALRGLKKILIYSYFKNVSFFISLIVFLTIFNCFDLYYVNTILLTLISSTLLYFITSAFFFMRSMKFERSSSLMKGVSSERMTEILKESTPMLLASSMMLLINWIDTLTVSYFGNQKDVGVYIVLLKISNLITIILISVNSISAPKFSELFYNNELEKLKNTVRRSTNLIFFASFPIFILLIFFGDKILGFIGPEYLIGSSALLFLLIGQFVNSISGSVGHLLQMTGHQKINQYIIFTALITQIILNFSLVPFYGIKGAAISSMISTSLWNLLGVYYVKKKLGILTFFVPKFRSGK